MAVCGARVEEGCLGQFDVVSVVGLEEVFAGVGVLGVVVGVVGGVVMGVVVIDVVLGLGGVVFAALLSVFISDGGAK